MLHIVSVLRIYELSAHQLRTYHFYNTLYIGVFLKRWVLTTELSRLIRCNILFCHSSLTFPEKFLKYKFYSLRIYQITTEKRLKEHNYLYLYQIRSIHKTVFISTTRAFTVFS